MRTYSSAYDDVDSKSVDHVSRAIARLLEGRSNLCRLLIRWLLIGAAAFIAGWGNVFSADTRAPTNRFATLLLDR